MSSNEVLHCVGSDMKKTKNLKNCRQICQLRLTKNEKVALGATFNTLSVGTHAPKNCYMNKHIQTEINTGLSSINILMFVDIYAYS
jgi:hypothetical protein